MEKNNTLVLNWHLTDVCNYRCKYCYASWEASVCKRELIHHLIQTETILTELYQFFRPDNDLNPLKKRFDWNSVRLNLAGGEPLFHTDKLLPIINKASELGCEVSLITNGSFLSDALLNAIVPQMTWLGVSIDSASPKTNRSIGRIDRHGRLLHIKNLAAQLNKARQLNSELRIKLNTVVNSLNCEESLSEVLTQISPDKWKVLRMLPVVNQDLVVSDEQFAAFVFRHKTFSQIMCAEDNRDMGESYIMIDPSGRFFQNNPDKFDQGYKYSRPILEVGAANAFAEVNFAHDLFNARYASDVKRAANEV
ncbi:MAG: viperin family antiviral radical SAM protein [Desulfovibrio sp.]